MGSDRINKAKLISRGEIFLRERTFQVTVHLSLSSSFPTSEEAICCSSHIFHHEKQLQQNVIIHHGKRGESLFYPHFDSVFSQQCCIMLCQYQSPDTHMVFCKAGHFKQALKLSCLYCKPLGGGRKLYIDRSRLRLIISLFKVSRFSFFKALCNQSYINKKLLLQMGCNFMPRRLSPFIKYNISVFF